jgi:hypothetical protein
MLEVDKLAEGEELGSNVLHLQVHYRLTSGKGFGPSLLGTDGAQWGQPFIFECSCPGRTFNSCNFPTRTKPSRRSGTSPSFPTSRPATTAASTRRSEPDRPSISRQERPVMDAAAFTNWRCWVHSAPRAIRAKPLSPSVARAWLHLRSCAFVSQACARQQCSNWTL